MLAHRLPADGFDVVAVAGHPTLVAASDEEVMRWAVAQGRRLVTENVKDFEPLVQLASESGEPTPLVLFTSSRRFPRSRRNPGPLFDALRRRLGQPTDHAGPTAWLR